MQNTSDRTREQQRSLERVGEVGHANCVTRTELTSCVSARPEAMSRRCRGDVEAPCDAVLSFLDQFDVPARSPPANEPNNPALTLREVEEGLANRTPRRYASLRNSFHRSKMPLDGANIHRSVSLYGSFESDTYFSSHSREMIEMDYKISTPLSHRCHFLKSYTLNFSLLLFPIRGKTASIATLHLARTRAVSLEQLVQESEDSQAIGREPACYDLEVARSFLPSSFSTRYEHRGKDGGKKRKEEEWIWSERDKCPSRTRARDRIYVQTEHVAACDRRNNTTVALEPEDRLGNWNVRQTERA